MDRLGQSHGHCEGSLAFSELSLSARGGHKFADDVMKGFASIVPPDADAAAVGEAIVKIVDAPFGKRPFRVHVDPTQDGAEVVNMVSDRVRAELLRRIGLVDVLTPRQLV